MKNRHKFKKWSFFVQKVMKNLQKMRIFNPKIAKFYSKFDFTFNSYVFACALPRFLPSTMLHLAICTFAKLCSKREAVPGQYCIFIRRSSRHPARPIPKQLTFCQWKNIIFRFRILEKNLKIQNFEKNRKIFTEESVSERSEFYYSFKGTSAMMSKVKES